MIATINTLLMLITVQDDYVNYYMFILLMLTKKLYSVGLCFCIILFGKDMHIDDFISLPELVFARNNSVNEQTQ